MGETRKLAAIAACHKAMGDALIIEKTAQCRLADSSTTRRRSAVS